MGQGNEYKDCTPPIPSSRFDPSIHLDIRALCAKALTSRHMIMHPGYFSLNWHRINVELFLASILLYGLRK